MAVPGAVHARKDAASHHDRRALGREVLAEIATLWVFFPEVAALVDTTTCSENAKFLTARTINAILVQAVHITGPRRYSRKAFLRRTSSRSLRSTIL